MSHAATHTAEATTGCHIGGEWHLCLECPLPDCTLAADEAVLRKPMGRLSRWEMQSFVERTIRVRMYGNVVVEVYQVGRARKLGHDSTHVYVCLPEEFARAKREQREPRLVGFRKELIVEAQP